MKPQITWPEVVDKGDGPAVVLLHPLGADHRYWNALMGRLAGYRLIAYDLPGHGGRPEISDGYHIEDLATDLAGLLDRLDIRVASVVGVSIGGLVVQAFAAEYPDRINHAVMVDTVAVYPEGFAANLAARAELVVSEGQAAVISPTLDMWFTKGFLENEPEVADLVSQMILAASPEGYAQACRALIAADLRPLASQITVPSTVICGSDDLPAFTQGARWLHESIEGSRLEWLNEGRHAAALECGDRFAVILEDVLPA